MASNILLPMKGSAGQRTSYGSENCFAVKTLRVVFLSLRTVGAKLTQNATALNSDRQSCGAYTEVPAEMEGSISLFRILWQS